MPRVIANKLTGETMPDTAENRIQTFRVECGSNYQMHKGKYETIIYGAEYDVSKIELIERYGLMKAHKEHITETARRKAEKQAKEDAEMVERVQSVSDSQAKDLLLELYRALDSRTQVEALDAIESYKDDARWCDSYR